MKFGELVGGPLGIVLTGAAMVSVAVPMTRKMIKPVAKQTIRTMYKLSDTVQETSTEFKREWQELLSEVRNDLKTDSVNLNNGESEIAQAWRNPEFNELQE